MRLLFVLAASLAFTVSAADESLCNPNPCENGGTCLGVGGGRDAGPASFECRCIAPFKGERCEMDPCNPTPCQNGGDCVLHSSGYQCFCREPYTGSHCEYELSPCNPNPCHNGATCRVVHGNTDYTCTCMMGYDGPTCDSRVKRGEDRAEQLEMLKEKIDEVEKLLEELGGEE